MVCPDPLKGAKMAHISFSISIVGISKSFMTKDPEPLIDLISYTDPRNSMFANNLPSTFDIFDIGNREAIDTLSVFADSSKFNELSSSSVPKPLTSPSFKSALKEDRFALLGEFSSATNKFEKTRSFATILSIVISLLLC